MRVSVVGVFQGVHSKLMRHKWNTMSMPMDLAPQNTSMLSSGKVVNFLRRHSRRNPGTQITSLAKSEMPTVCHVPKLLEVFFVDCSLGFRYLNFT